MHTYYEREGGDSCYPTDPLLSVRYYWQMCKVVEENPQESVPTSSANQSVTKNLLPLETICEDVNRILSPGQTKPPTSEDLISNRTQQSQAESGVVDVSITGSPSAHQDDHGPASTAETEMMDIVTESEPLKESSKLTDSNPDLDPAKAESEATVDPSPPQALDVTEDDVEMDDAPSNGSTQKSEQGVIVLDD
jgi:hypothetical protein